MECTGPARLRERSASAHSGLASPFGQLAVTTWSDRDHYPGDGRCWFLIGRIDARGMGIAVAWEDTNCRRTSPWATLLER
jgi:hypothetical protein